MLDSKRGGGRQEDKKKFVKLKKLGHDGSTIYGSREVRQGLLWQRKSEQTYHKSILNAFFCLHFLLLFPCRRRVYLGGFALFR